MRLPPWKRFHLIFFNLLCSMTEVQLAHVALTAHVEDLLDLPVLTLDVAVAAAARVHVPLLVIRIGGRDAQRGVADLHPRVVRGPRFAAVVVDEDLGRAVGLVGDSGQLRRVS